MFLEELPTFGVSAWHLFPGYDGSEGDMNGYFGERCEPSSGATMTNLPLRW